MNPSTVDKINAQNLGCKRDAVAKLPNDSTTEIRMFRVFGIAMGLIRQESDAGEYFAVTGRFIGENTQQGTDDFGKTFASDTLFLPPGAHDKLVTEIMEAGVTFDEPNARSKKQNGIINNGVALRYAADVYAKRDRNPSGIAYVTRVLFSVVHDQMADVRTMVAEVEAHAGQQAQHKPADAANAAKAAKK